MPVNTVSKIDVIGIMIFSVPNGYFSRETLIQKKKKVLVHTMNIFYTR
jgi:hypothetical protein